MTYEHSGARHGNPMGIFLVVVFFLIFVVWMASSVAPGGASHTHLVGCGDAPLLCGAGNATAGEVAPGTDPTNFYNVPGGSTDNFQSFYNGFILLGVGSLTVLALMAGFVVWMFRGKEHV